MTPRDAASEPPRRKRLVGFQETPDWHRWKRSRKLHVFDAAGDYFVSLCGRAAVGNDIRREFVCNPPSRCIICGRRVAQESGS